jgi:subtilisin family serine protease
MLPAILIVFSLLVPASAQALSTLPLAPAGSTDADPDLLDAYNLLAGTSYTSNADLESFLVGDDETYLATDQTIAVAVSTSAGNSNNFGFYTDLGTAANTTTLFEDLSGHLFLDTPTFDAEYLFDTDGGAEVGFFLSTIGWNDANTWHSESDLDAAFTTFDHMIAYSFPGTVTLTTDLGEITLEDGWLIGWEDLTESDPSDGDYNDFIVLVGNRYTTPEPASGLLFSFGMLGLALSQRRSHSR